MFEETGGFWLNLFAADIGCFVNEILVSLKNSRFGE